MGIDIDISTHQSEVFAGEVVQGSVAVTVVSVELYGDDSILRKNIAQVSSAVVERSKYSLLYICTTALSTVC